MDRWLGKFSPHIFALLRIVAGVLFAFHGSQKLLGFPPSEMGGELNLMMTAAGVIELVGGLLIAVGLFGSFAAFIASGQMAFAYFIAHAPQAALPIQNGGELAVIYCFLFLYVAAHGSGIWSVDAVRADRGD